MSPEATRVSRKKKRRYDDNSYEGYGDEYEEGEAAYDDDDDGEGKKRKKKKRRKVRCFLYRISWCSDFNSPNLLVHWATSVLITNSFDVYIAFRL